MPLVDPLFRPDPDDLRICQVRMRELYDPKWPSIEIGAKAAKDAVDRIASRATEAVLAQLPAPHSWFDANKRKRGQEGYDYVVNDRCRLQVKGSMLIEQPGWAHKPALDHVSLDYDVVLFVHIGCCLDTNWGRFGKYSWPKQDTVDIYVMPNALVRAWVATPRYLNDGRVELYWNRRAFAPHTKQHIGQTREILEHRNRFDLIEALLT